MVAISIIFFLDRYSKNLILEILEDEKYLIINDYINLNLVFNTGIGFGLFSFEAGIYYNLLSFLIFFIIYSISVHESPRNPRQPRQEVGRKRHYRDERR